MAISENSTVRTAPPRRVGAVSGSLVVDPGCPSAVVDAYHTLLTNVDLELGANAGGMVAVAAVDATASAALVAANLAIVAAQSGDRTLLVDCDVQNPALHEVFGLDMAPGMAQLMGGEHNDLRALAQPTELPTLGVVTAGLSGSRHGRLTRLGDVPATLLRLKNAADRVILVAPPVLGGTDLLRLAPYVDGILLVLTPGRTRRELAARAREVLEKAEAPVVGAALAPN